MSKLTPSDLMYQIRSRKEELEFRSASILGARRTAFQDMSLRSPQLSPPELAFYQVVTWLYGYYFEVGRVSLRYLLQQFSVYGQEHGGRHKRHYEEVRLLRTYLQHNLNLDSSNDFDTQRRCEDWFLKSCGSVMPGSGCEWGSCLTRILVDARSFLVAAVECVRCVERDESSQFMLDQWSARLSRYHPIRHFEELVAIIIHDMGQDALDYRRIARQHYQQWNSDLQSRSENYSFEEEARKLVERTILNEADLPLPITGGDIMREFGIRPGSEVGRLLRKARALYLDDPCHKELLLSRLRNSKDLA